MSELRVCVIGSGAAGLTVIKQLKDQGATNIDCFEKELDVGGIFNWGQDKNGVYDNAVLTISNYLMAFSDMPPEGHRYHWHHSEYLEYLHEYARRYDLRKHITFGTVVASVQGGPRSWEVVIQAAGGGQLINKGIYDVVAVCSGAHQGINVPMFPGMDEFKGKIVHSSAYKNNKDFVGKHCVCVGMGESGADIVREISDVSAQPTVLAMRSFPYLIPRLVRPFHTNPMGCSSDSFTSHLRHDLLNVPLSRYSKFKHFVNRVMYTLAAFLFLLFPWLGRSKEQPTKDAFNQDASTSYVDKDTMLTPLVAKLILSFCDLSGQGEKGQKFACKNVTFVENMVQGKIATNVSGIKELMADRVVFNDGSSAQCECLVMCTGYKDEFPFLKGTIAGTDGIPLCVPDRNVRRLYKHIFHPSIGESMAWIGFVRPSTGGIPACAEMAARYFALVVTRQRRLPRNIAELTQAEAEFDSRFFQLSPDVKTLVGYKDWMDSMAELVGCEVRLINYIFQPQLFVRLAIGSLLPSQYRLSGPCSMPDLAKSTIMRVPVAPTRSQTMYEVWRCWLRHIFALKVAESEEEK